MPATLPKFTPSYIVEPKPVLPAPPVYENRLEACRADFAPVKLPLFHKPEQGSMTIHGKKKEVVFTENGPLMTQIKAGPKKRVIELPVVFSKAGLCLPSHVLDDVILEIQPIPKRKTYSGTMIFRDPVPRCDDVTVENFQFTVAPEGEPGYLGLAFMESPLSVLSQLCDKGIIKHKTAYMSYDSLLVFGKDMSVKKTSGSTIELGRDTCYMETTIKGHRLMQRTPEDYVVELDPQSPELGVPDLDWYRRMTKGFVYDPDLDRLVGDVTRSTSEVFHVYPLCYSFTLADLQSRLYYENGKPVVGPGLFGEKQCVLNLKLTPGRFVLGSLLAKHAADLDYERQKYFVFKLKGW